MDIETLIVCCDWLVWQKVIREKRHCVHYELGIFDCSDPDPVDTSLSVRANDWMFDEGRDLTLFRGVSLGSTFGNKSSACLISFLRIEKSLHKLIERFSPEEILYFNYSNDFYPSMLSMTSILQLISFKLYPSMISMTSILQ